MQGHLPAERRPMQSVSPTDVADHNSKEIPGYDRMASAPKLTSFFSRLCRYRECGCNGHTPGPLCLFTPKPRGSAPKTRSGCRTPPLPEAWALSPNPSLPVSGEPTPWRRSAFPVPGAFTIGPVLGNRGANPPRTPAAKESPIGRRSRPHTLGLMPLDRGCDRGPGPASCGRPRFVRASRTRSPDSRSGSVLPPGPWRHVRSSMRSGLGSRPRCP